MNGTNRRRRVRRWMATGFWVLADQAVVSGGSFLATVLLARSLGPADFGVYAWALIGVLLVSEVAASVILAPHSVIGATLARKAYVVHTSTMAAMQAVVGVASAALALLAAVFAEVLADGAGQTFVAVAAALLGWQAREFIRRVLQTVGRWRESLFIATVATTTQLAALLLLLEVGRLTPSSALWVLASASCVAAGLGIFLTRNALSARVDRRFMREAWTMGRWLLGSSAATQVGRYVEGIVLPVVAGPAAFGLYRALTQLIAVFDLPIKALGNFLRPTLSRRSVAGTSAVNEVVRPLLWGGSAALLAAAGVAGLLGRQVLELVYGDQYVAVAHLVFVVSLYPLLTFGRTVLGSAIIAVDRSPRSLLYSAAAASIGAVVVGSASIVVWGLNGAPAAVITGGVIAIGWLWAAWSKKTRSSRSATRDPAEIQLNVDGDLSDWPDSLHSNPH